MTLAYFVLAFSLLALFCSLMVVISRNPIHSILYLILVFCNVSFVLIILGVELVAITFLIVYVGAIAVLFLFVVMMLNIKIIELDNTFWKYIPVGLAISSAFLFQLFHFVFKKSIIKTFHSPIHAFPKPSPHVKKLEMIFPNSESFSDMFVVFFPHVEPTSLFYFELFSEFTNTQLLGWLLYTYTFFVFLVIGLILLVAMVGSIVLVLNQNINIKRQSVFRQTVREVKSSISLRY